MSGIVVKINQIESDIRGLQNRLEKAELREKQLIIMFKMILDKYLNHHRTNKKITMNDIVGFMEQLVNKNLEPEEKRETTDLISELIKKGL